jgi:hypothetical protein
VYHDDASLYGPVRWCKECGAQLELVFDTKTDEMWTYCPYCMVYIKGDDYHLLDMKTIRHKVKNDELCATLYTTYWAKKYRKTWKKMAWFFKDGPCYCQEVADEMKEKLDAINPVFEDFVEERASLLWKLVKYEKESNKVYNTNCCCPYIDDANGDDDESNNKDNQKSLNEADAMAYEPATYVSWHERNFWQLFSKAITKDNIDEATQLWNWNRSRKWMTQDKAEYVMELMTTLTSKQEKEVEEKHQEMQKLELQLLLRQ